MKLSLAIITGNIGGAMMRRFLTHFRPIVDEVVIVRAIGCQEPDDTIAAAMEFPGVRVGYYENKPQHRDWPHVDDFAAARNRAWEMAEGEWIMWADTDDIITEEDGRKLRLGVERHGDKADMFRTPYLVPDNAVTDNLRERVVRRGIARWVQPVHECLEPIDPSQKWRTVDLDVRFIHDPGPRPPAGRNGRNLRILRSIPSAERTTSLAYHEAGECFAMGEIEAGGEAVARFLQRPDAGENERFEMMLSMSMVLTDPKEKAAWLHLAWQECPHRREPLMLLANLELVDGNAPRALSYLRAAATLPLPEPAPWNLRRKFWGWAHAHEEARALRTAGNFAKADTLELNHFVRHGGKISLLHATRGRAQKAVEARFRWLERAANPDAIEHIFACDPDDEQGPLLGGFRHIVQDAGDGPVGAWNLAATVARGEVLVQVSDDMVPPMNWDAHILAAIGDTSRPAVLRVSDGHRTDGLIVLAIVTRAFVKAQGYLFHPAFFSMWSDNWLTENAIRRRAIIDAPHIVFEHQHPAFGKAEMDATYARSNRLLHYAEGRKIYDALFENREPFTWREIPGLSADGSPALVHERIISQLTAPLCIEVGVAQGQGLACMAMLAEYKGGKAFGVDTFQGTAADPIDYPADMEQRCRDYLSRCGVNPGLIVATSQQAAAESGRADYIFLDAAHDYDSIRDDIAAWWPHVAPGGWLAGHDYTHSEGVRRAVDEAFPHAEKLGECWFIQKPNV